MPMNVISANVVGATQTFESPFGSKVVCYADFTASGRAVQKIEDYIQKQVLPLYGNTHTTTSATGNQITAFRHEARQIIADTVNAKLIDGPNGDSVLFSGSGSTSAINKLVSILGLTTKYGSSNAVVFIGPYEHHSNMLPWRESGAQVVNIPENDEGMIDLCYLEKKLKEFSKAVLKVGCFSAASNITGVLSDTDAISVLLHRYGALAIYDFATAAPHTVIDMNPVVEGDQKHLVYKDAIYFSGHKFIGGPGTPGVLVLKKKLFSKTCSTSQPGGGTVLYVTANNHKYLDNNEDREEGGTPDIIGSIRLGLAFRLKQQTGPAEIMRIEREHVQRVRLSLKANKRIVLMGNQDLDQLPIFSFLIRFGNRFLHYNFVCALLNDLFGIQSRGGCACAGPYAAKLLGISPKDTELILQVLTEGLCAFKPGFTRFSLTYFMDDSEIDYILNAIHFVAEHGWKFLSSYRFSMYNATWKHVSELSNLTTRKSLCDLIMDAEISSGPEEEPERESMPSIEAHRLENFEIAYEFAETCMRESIAWTRGRTSLFNLDGPYPSLRWFLCPDEGLDEAIDDAEMNHSTHAFGPIHPERYRTQCIDNNEEENHAYSQECYSLVDSSMHIRPGRRIRSWFSGVSQRLKTNLSSSSKAPKHFCDRKAF
ncbi:hypothetical protein ABG067_004423 [Albugo candida]